MRTPHLQMLKDFIKNNDLDEIILDMDKKGLNILIDIIEMQHKALVDCRCLFSGSLETRCWDCAVCKAIKAVNELEPFEFIELAPFELIK